MQQEQFIGGTAMFAATFQNRYIRAQATSWNGFSSALVSCSIAPHRVASTDGRRLGFRASTAKLETAVHRCNGSGRIKKPGVNTVITTLNRSPKTSGSAAPYEYLRSRDRCASPPMTSSVRKQPTQYLQETNKN